jgi:hypothetical protein
MFTVRKTNAIIGTIPYDTETVVSPKQCMTYRDDTLEPLGVVSKDYPIIQPFELMDLMRIVTNEEPEVKWNGSKMLISAPMATMDLGNDEVTARFNILNSWDGSTSMYGMGSTFRLVCYNQMSMLFRTAKQKNQIIKIRHTRNFSDRLDDFRDMLNRVKTHQSTWNTNVSALVNRQIKSTEELRNLWQTVSHLALPDITNEADRAVKFKGFVNYCTETFESEQATGIKPSYWLAANAVTKYIQHYTSGRGRKADQDTRYIDCTIGQRSQRTSKVMELALAEVA